MPPVRAAGVAARVSRRPASDGHSATRSSPCARVAGRWPARPAAWPLAARAQQPAMPVIGFLDSRLPDAITDRLRAFRQGLKDVDYVEGENLATFGPTSGPNAPRFRR